MTETVSLFSQDPQIVKKVRDACCQTDATLTHHATLDDAPEDFVVNPPDLILCDYETFERLRPKLPRACVLLYSEPAGSEQAIEAIKRGALDYLVTPIDTKTLTQHIVEALRISRDVRVPAVYESIDDEPSVERIVGQSPAMRQVYKMIGRIAPRDVNVLIAGESGTGKELIARAILHHSTRLDQPYLAVNCAAIPETLIESELFGHEKGAFTGATHRRIGKFEQCDGGTLFLDEIGDIPLATQAKLLRVLQDHSFQRLGGTESITANVRIIGATHQPLELLIREKKFRQDLYFRLNVARIDIPPLRNREVDVVLLAHWFVRRYNRRLGADIRSLSPEILPVLLRYSWPGNVRELENAIKSALVIARGSVLRMEHLPEPIRESVDTSPPLALPTSSPTDEARHVAEMLFSHGDSHGNLHQMAKTIIEREVICVCLEHTRGQVSPAARILGISRTTLRKKIAHYGVRTTTSIELER